MTSNISVNIDSGNGLAPNRHQTITWNYGDVWLIGTYFSEISIKIV